MKTVGIQLQEARAAKDWSPEIAARETKIKVERLRDLEADDYTHFSSPTYARGFVRTYARALGLDEYKVLRQLDNKLPEDDNATFVNDTGIPYVPEASQISAPIQVSRGVYVAAGIGASLLFLIGFILLQSYRAGYFSQASPARLPLPLAGVGTGSADTDPSARALPADSNAPPVAVPAEVTPGAPTASTAADSPQRALPVDPNAAPPPVTATPVAAENPTAGTTPLDTKTPPRALPVDLSALAAPAAAGAGGDSSPAPASVSAPSADGSSMQAGPGGPSTDTAQPVPAPAAVPVVTSVQTTAEMPATSTPTLPPDGAPVVSSTPPLAAVLDKSVTIPDSPASPPASTTPDSDAAASPSAATTTPDPVSTNAAPPRALPVDISATAPAVAETAPPSLAPMASREPVRTDDAETGATAPAPGPADDTSSGAAGSGFRGQRLVLTASHDSFIRVVALDHGQKIRYASVLHTGQSISFNDHKYSINVGVPSAVDIALDGVNYGPHSERASPDTFTVESHTP